MKCKLLFGVLLSLILITQQALANDIYLYREPTSEIVSVDHGSLILNRGKLRKASKCSSTANYLFTEEKVGARPLVLIGTEYEIMEYFVAHANDKIENRIESLPGFFVGIDEYKPTDRFESLFSPVAIGTKFVADVFKTFGPDLICEISAGGMSTTGEVGGVLEGIVGYLRDSTPVGSKTKGWLKSIFKKKEPQLYYVKFGYMPGDGMTKISNPNNPQCTDRLCSFGSIVKEIDKTIKLPKDPGTCAKKPGNN